MKLLSSALKSLPFFFCLSAFAIQLYGLLKHFIAPSMTNTYVEEVSLEEMDFPLNIKICVRPGLNSSALDKLGYSGSSYYVRGSSKYNQSVISWGGYDEKGAAITTAKEVINLARPDEWNDYLPIIRYGNNYTTSSTTKLKLNKVNWLDECHFVNLSDIDHESKAGRMMFTISFNKTLLKDNITVELNLEGKSLATHRQIQSNQFYSTGDIITLRKGLSSYIVKVKKQVFVEEDPRKACRNYPNQDFNSYADCDDHYMRDRIEAVAPGLNLTPPWLTDNLDKVTQEPVLAFSQILGENSKRLLRKCVLETLTFQKSLKPCFMV